MLRHRASLFSNLAFALGFLLFASTDAFAFDEDSAAAQANKGFHLGLGPELLIPTDSNRPLGGGLVLDGRYGIDLNPVIIGPGARLGGYVISERLVGVAMGTLRVTFPLGPLAPFLIGGIGGGGLTNDSESGLALMGGAGLMIHLGKHFAFGVEGDYETITTTEFKEFSIGPAIQISF
jgi:hypothetical protein